MGEDRGDQDRVDDLDVPESESEDVKGGAGGFQLDLDGVKAVTEPTAVTGNRKYGDIVLKRG